MAPRRKVPEGEEFVFCNGRTAASVSECWKQIEQLDAVEFAYHVNETKNDFYTWIRDCIDPKFAEKIKDICVKEEMVQAMK